MKIKIIFSLFFVCQLTFAQFDFERHWGTYIGNAGLNIINSVTDTEGNIYLCVGIYNGSNLGFNFITSNAFQSTPNNSAIIKINTEGIVVWGTYINADLTDMQLDTRNNNLVVIGYAQPSSINLISANAYETIFEAASMVLVKFDYNGTKLWGTYYNVGAENISIGATLPSLAIDLLGNIYFSHRAGYSTLGTEGAFQTVKNGVNPYAISKFSQDGVKVWTTYYGINGSSIQKISINSNGLFVTGRVKDCPPAYNNPNTYFATAGAYQPTALGSCNTNYLSKFNFDGQRIWSTYFKLLNNVKAAENSVYVTSSFNQPSLITSGTFQQNSDISSVFLGKFNDLGQPIWGTHIGLNGGFTSGNGTGLKVEIDNLENVYLFGGTKCTTNIATSDGFLTANPSTNYGAGYVMKFNPNGQRLWGTYYGDSQNTIILSLKTTGDFFYISGTTNCEENIATSGSLQPNYLTSNPTLVPYNTFLARFNVQQLSINQNTIKNILITPNPNIGTFSISNLEKESFIEIYDNMGKKVHEQNINNNQVVNLQTVSRGIYFAKIKSGDKVYKTEKIVVE